MHMMGALKDLEERKRQLTEVAINKNCIHLLYHMGYYAETVQEHSGHACKDRY